MSHRKDKIERMIKEEISWIFLHKLKDPALGFITITNVKVSPDLKIAKIYFSVFDRNSRKAALSKINELKGIIRSELAHKIQMRYVPELDFYVDDTPDFVEKIEGLFRQIHENDERINNERMNGSKGADEENRNEKGNDEKEKEDEI